MKRRILISILCFALPGCGLGPRSQESSTCSFCARHRNTVWTLLGTTESVTDTSASRWIDKVYPEHRDHAWLPISASNQLVFPIGTVGCHGIGGSSSYIVALINDSRHRIGEEKAIEFLDEYHKAVKKGEDAIRQFAKEIRRPDHPLYKRVVSESE